jgi:predicted nucleic acid-binding protein
MRRRYYFDTSVFGGVFDDEFRKESIQLFEQVKRGEVICLFSEIVEKELMNAPDRVKLIAERLPQESIERLAMFPAIKEIAAKYIKEKIVGVTSYEDCLHIATATAYNADALVSWNFKHMLIQRGSQLTIP